MVKAGDTMVSKETGETFVFLKTAADTGGRLLLFQMKVAPGGGAIAAPIHVHPISEERFLIQKGAIRFQMNGEEFVAGPGDRVTVPAGAAHTWRNAGSGPAEFMVEVEPALHMEDIFENLCAQSQRGMLGPHGEMNLLRVGVQLDTYRDHLYMAGAPILAQKVVLAALAFFGRLRGYPPTLTYSAPKRESATLQPVRA